MELSRKHKFQLAIVIFPVSVQIYSEVSDDYPQQKMLQYCSAKNVPCLDLLPVLRVWRNENIFFDHCHLTATGNKIVAEAISEFLYLKGF